MTRRFDGWPAPALVLLAAALAHLPSLFNGFVWDDSTFILGNPVLRDAGNIPGLFAHPETWGTGYVNRYYRPLTMLSFLADTLLWGAAPAGFHATNVLLHLGVCALLFANLRRLLAPGAALAATLLFAVHPANAEPVAFVSARADLLCALFLLAAFLAWARYGETGGRGALALSSLAYVAALLSKIAAGLYPAVFALYALLFFRRRLRVRDLLPFAAAALAFLAVRGAVLDGIAGSDQPLTFRAATAGPLVVRYVLMALSPAHLSVFHDLPVRTAFDAAVLGAWGAIAVAVALAAAQARRAPRVALGFAWFLAGVVPVSGVITLLSPALAADRYLYLPLLGSALAAGAGLQSLAALRMPEARRRLMAGAAALALAALLGVTMARGRLWRDSVTLWERAAAEAPRSQYALNALGWAYKLVGRDEEARSTLLHSLEVNEASSEAHLNLAGLALLRNDLAAAERHTLRTLELAPQSAIAYRYLGIILSRKGDDATALRAAEQAFAIDASDAATHELLGALRSSVAGPGATAN